jgi:uncharacterized protein YjbI with pentapeptide repeats
VDQPWPTSALQIWPGEISGFGPNRDYGGLQLGGPRAAIAPGTDLHGSNFAGAFFASTTFKGCDLGNVHFRGAQFGYTGETAYVETFDGDNLAGTDFSKLDLRSAKFTKTILRPVSIGETNTPGPIFVEANLSGVTFAGAALEGAKFAGANLQGTTFSGGTDLRGANFDGTDPSMANFDDGVLLEGADFSKATVTLDFRNYAARNGGKVPPIPGASSEEEDVEGEGLAEDLIEVTIAAAVSDISKAVDQMLEKLDETTNKRDSIHRGDFLLLTLEQKVIEGGPDREAAVQWQTWLKAHNGKLAAWDWSLWNRDLQRSQLSKICLAKLDLIQSSAKGKITPDRFYASFMKLEAAAAQPVPAGPSPPSDH